jgi:uridylate kinase
MAQPPYGRIILKVSGEVLGGTSGAGLDIPFIGAVLDQIKDLLDSGIQVGIVVGGGNVLRGGEAVGCGLGRVSADYIGMLGTMINGIAMRDVGASRGMEIKVMSCIDAGGFTEPYVVERAEGYLQAGLGVVFVGGTGNPFLTTDTAAALRAAELKADVLLKATKVDGVYSSDPNMDPAARRFDRISFRRAMAEDLGFMDRSALCICSRAEIPVIVFNIYESDSIRRVARDGDIGTVVEGVRDD